MFGWLKRKKTYLVSAAGVIGGVLLIVEGQLEQGIGAILASLGLGSLRAGVAKAEDTVAGKTPAP